MQNTKIMRTLLLFIVFLFASSTVFSYGKLKEKDKNNIQQLLNNQVLAWNQGDLEKFMKTYWDSEKLVFVGSRGPTYGWKATLENYKLGYPDKNAMGQLEFKIFDMSKIDRKTVFVIGRYELTRKAGDLKGHFTLVIQKIGGNWLIVSDHSSAGN